MALREINVWVFHDKLGPPEYCGKFNTSADLPQIPPVLLIDPPNLKGLLVQWWKGLHPPQWKGKTDAELGDLLVSWLNDYLSPAPVPDDEIKHVMEVWWYPDLKVGDLDTYIVERRSDAFILMPIDFDPDRQTPKGQRLDAIRHWTPGQRLN